MTDFKDLEIKTLAQAVEFMKGATYTAIRSDWGTPATDVFDRYLAQERAALEAWPAFKALVLDAARRTWPDATITEIGDEIVVTLPGALKTVECNVQIPLVDDPETDGLAPDPETERLKGITCPECHGKLAPGRARRDP
jgi:hypothetical protein